MRFSVTLFSLLFVAITSMASNDYSIMVVHEKVVSDATLETTYCSLSVANGGTINGIKAIDHDALSDGFMSHPEWFKKPITFKGLTKSSDNQTVPCSLTVDISANMLFAYIHSITAAGSTLFVNIKESNGDTQCKFLVYEPK